jgi:hypothetical protein
MTQVRLCSVMTMVLILLPTIGTAQVSGSGKPNSVPLWTGTTNPSSTLGDSVISQNPNNKVVSVGSPLQGPSGMLFYHASFQGAVKNSSGSNTGFSAFDGFVILQTGIDTSDFLDLTSNPVQDPFNPNVVVGLNKPGAFLSLRLKALTGPALAGQPAYFVAGQAGQTNSQGFGFKTVGGSNCGGGVLGGRLKGVTILNGSETVVDLASNVCESKPAVNLLAVRNTSSVSFYVNGVLKGTSTTNLPVNSFSMYDLLLQNSNTASQMGGQSWWVSFLTVGIPMF